MKHFYLNDDKKNLKEFFIEGEKYCVYTSE